MNVSQHFCRRLHTRQSLRVWISRAVHIRQVECSVSDKPEGSEQAYNIMITTKTTLDNTSTAIWSNIPSVAIHTIKVDGGVGSSRTAISLALIHDISRECKTIYSSTIHLPSNWNVDPRVPQACAGFLITSPVTSDRQETQILLRCSFLNHLSCYLILTATA